MSTKNFKNDSDLSTVSVDKIREAFGLDKPDIIPVFKTAYDGNNQIYSNENALHFSDDNPESISLTKQSFSAECDINNILAMHAKTGAITHYRDDKPRYGDFSDPVDYQTAMHIVIDAQNAFDDLPAKVREKFHNDPKEYLEFCSDEKNRDQMVALGIIDAPTSLPETPEVAPQPPEGETRSAPTTQA